MANRKIEFGDFQTPPALAAQISTLLSRRAKSFGGVIEPTCGTGTILSAVGRLASNRVLGFEVNPAYVTQARERLRRDAVAGDVVHANFFEVEWHRVIESMSSPVLVVGNPPWVTNSQLGAIGGTNLPKKSNFKKHVGLDALTGKANFDVCEWVLLQLMSTLDGRDGTLAMLCKTSVARKALHSAWESGHQLSKCSLFSIDAKRHFGANVSAVLLVVEYAEKGAVRCADVFPSLTAATASSVITTADGKLIADLDAYRRSATVRGHGEKWRSGVKHDASGVMELRRYGSLLKNGAGEVVDVEGKYLFPMLKSSDVAAGRVPGQRMMLVPQRRVGQETAGLVKSAPRLWAYLVRNAQRLDSRRSAIYRGRPRFSIFGVGDYTFAPWKVAVSGFYKPIEFRVIGPCEGKPVVFDDTVYFLPFDNEADARDAAAALAEPEVRDYFKSLVFPDAKRPVTAEILRGIVLPMRQTGLWASATSCG